MTQAWFDKLKSDPGRYAAWLFKKKRNNALWRARNPDKVKANNDAYRALGKINK